MTGIKIIAKNKKAHLNYEIEEKMEAGIVLKGTEVKSIRQGRINIKDGYVMIKKGEAWLINTHISPYPPAGLNNHSPERERKLLLHRKEIDRLTGKSQQRGYTIIPLSVYLKRNRVKVEIGIGRGRKKYEKKEKIKERDIEREIRRDYKQRIK